MTSIYGYGKPAKHFLDKCLQYHEDHEMPTDQSGLRRTKQTHRYPLYVTREYKQKVS